jgi:hypothetical protein
MRSEYYEYDKRGQRVLHYTNAPFTNWTRGGLLNEVYAAFRRKSDWLLVPRRMLTPETRAALESGAPFVTAVHCPARGVA